MINTELRKKIIGEICENKIIAILRGIPSDKLPRLAEALYDGGIRFLEITFCADGSTVDSETAENIKLLSSTFDGRMHIGAGTVLTCDQVRLAYENGARYIISPNVDPDVAKETLSCGMVYIPGAFTPTEIRTAHVLGADFVKIFPVSNVGADYVKAVKAPLSDIKYLAVGGINPDNMSEYLKAGVCGFGIGASIAPKSMLDSGDYDGITDLAKKYVSRVK